MVSKALENEIENISKEVENIHIISMGCDTKKFGRKFRRENYFNQGNKKIVLFVGRLAEKKGC